MYFLHVLDKNEKLIPSNKNQSPLKSQKLVPAKLKKIANPRR